MHVGDDIVVGAQVQLDALEVGLTVLWPRLRSAAKSTTWLPFATMMNTCCARAEADMGLAIGIGVIVVLFVLLAWLSRGISDDPISKRGDGLPPGASGGD